MPLTQFLQAIRLIQSVPHCGTHHHLAWSRDLLKPACDVYRVTEYVTVLSSRDETTMNADTEDALG